MQWSLAINSTALSCRLVVAILYNTLLSEQVNQENLYRNFLHPQRECVHIVKQDALYRYAVMSWTDDELDVVRRGAMMRTQTHKHERV